MCKKPTYVIRVRISSNSLSNLPPHVSRDYENLIDDPEFVEVDRKVIRFLGGPDNQSRV